tara:strand:- start:1238 stop:1390 length:153 start_codon:yes stop_codon:yes gene_type:complete
MENPSHQHQELASPNQSVPPPNSSPKIPYKLNALPTPNHQIQPQAAEKPS